MLISDARGREYNLPIQFNRIVSLVPSTTETLFDLGCGQHVVGITRFCVHPKDKLKNLLRVGGTKDVLWDRLSQSNPDLVIGNIEENTKEIFEKIDALGINSYVAYPTTVKESLQDLLNMGLLLGKKKEAQSLVKNIESLLKNLPSKPFSYVYLIWKKPWMAAGSDTFISSMLSQLGGHNIINSTNCDNTRYPELTTQLNLLSQADKILLSSEPYPFREKHILELMNISGLSKDRFMLLDGELCSWHGSRMKLAFTKLPELLR
ncbi:MAG: cobalamin-binding protein [Proteobacteria bacterium]|nr:cobalamin-binding protein [Pseudomonadota bacterium]